MASSGVELVTAWVRMVPTFEGVTDNVVKAFAPATKAAEKEGDKAGSGFSQKAKKAITGGAIVAGTVAAFKGLYDVGAIFDDVTDTIRVGTGAQGAALDGLVDTAKNVGKNVPIAFEKIGPTVADLNTRFGMSGKTLEKVASQYLEAGRILGEDVDIGKTSAAFSAFKIEGDNVSGAMDTLFQVSQATGVGMNDLASGVQAAAPALQTLGFGFEDSIALMGSLDKAGMNSTAVLASMSKGMVTLAKDGEEPQEAFKRVVGELEGFVSTGDKAAALDLASTVFGTRGAAQFVGALESGALNMTDLMAATGATGDTILGVGEETMDFAEQWQLLMNNALVAIEPLASAVFAAVGDGLKAAMPFLKDLGAWVSDNTKTIAVIAGVIGVTLAGAFLVWTASIWAATAAMLANPITWLVIGIGLIIAGVVMLAMKWGEVTKFITDVWAGFVSWITDSMTALGDWFAGVWDGFVQLVADGWGAITGFLSEAWANVVAIWESVWNGISSFFTNIWNTISRFAKSSVDKVTSIVSAATGFIKTGWEAVWGGISRFFSAIWQGIVWAVTTYINGIKLVISTGVNVVRSVWESVWNTVASIITNVWGRIKNTIQTMIDFVRTKPKQAFEAARDAIGYAWKGIQELAAKPVRFVVDTVINGLIGTINKLPGVDIPKISLPRGFARGGILPGMSSMSDGDDQLIMARRGEGMMVSEALRTPADRSAFLAANAAGRRGVGFASLLQGFARGGLIHPMPGAVVTTTWMGYPNHTGIDLAKPQGTPIQAAGAGTVSKQFYHVNYGNMVDVAHGGGLSTRYAHMLGNVPVSLGDRVKAGQVVGYEGSTGNSTGPHLHYEVMHNGNPVDPAPYLTGGGVKPLFGVIEGLMDFATGAFKKAFPGGGLWADAAGGVMKSGVKGIMGWATDLLSIGGGGAVPKLFDNGGWLPTGLTLTNNKTGTPEPVLTRPQWNSLSELASGGGRRGLDGGRFELRLDNGERLTGMIREVADRLVSAAVEPVSGGALASAHGGRRW